ncbi:hypothetical protein [uncultured Arcticibacterium sp.]|uniref:hypothetical protein n=1 Tax=uncultured Arcticibacterium sp. TaxID=2173042 RepID=UPI0030FB2E01
MDIEKLIEKYKAGETTLKEEQFLLENTSDVDTEMSAWFQYAKQKRKEPTPALKEKIWASISKKRIPFRIGMFAAAASILFLAVFFIHNARQEKLAYEKKEATLKEALAMLSEPEIIPSKKNIIYEDELVIIYNNPE